LDRGAVRELVANGRDHDLGRLLEGEPADTRAKRGEGDARRTDLPRPGHRAPNGRFDHGRARPSIAIERHGVDDGLGREVAGRGDDRTAERHGGLAHRRELDRVAARALQRATDAGRHPQREVGGVHDRVDLQLADVTVPELDALQVQPFRSVSVRRPTGPVAAWYTRGNRRDRFTRTSHEIVVRSCASASTPIRSRPSCPIRTNSSSVVTGGPGTSVTSAMTASMATLPTSGTPTPRTSARARLESRLDQPSA